MSQRAPSLDRLRDAIDADRRALCDALRLRPDGKRYFCWRCQCDGKRHADGDFSIERGFKCHKCGWSGDGLDLICAVKGCDFPAAVEFAQSVYHVPAGTDTAPAPKPKATKGKKTHATVDAAVGAACWRVEQDTGHKWREIRRDFYRDADGRDVAAVLRFERADGAKKADGKPYKEPRPIHAVKGGWKVGDPPCKWPPFMLPELLASAGPVWACEGETPANAGAEIGLTCTTSAHGAKSPAKTDWQHLAGRDVVILPDNDEGGNGYAEAVAKLCHAAGARSVKILALHGLPPKGDLADFVAMRSGKSPEEIRAEIERLADAVEPWTPPKETTDAPSTSNPIEAAKSGLPFAMTDLGNAERLVASYGDKIRWDVARKAWRAWDGRRWALDSALRVNTLAAETARAIRHEAAAAPSGNGDGRDLGQDLFRHAVKSESRDRLNAMIEVAKARPGIAVAANDLDADPWLLNVANGTIDLQTGTLRPHNRADMLTKLAPVEYRPGHRDERLERFLCDATGDDEDVIRFLQLVAGYTLTGLTVEEILLLIYGPEASGKSTFLDMLRSVLGDYAQTIDCSMLMQNKAGRSAGSASPEVACLAGARLAAGSESDSGRELAEAVTKNLTGGEPITARHLYAEQFSFRPQFKLWLAMNHCPRVSAEDGAIWRRILRIGFEHTVPPERRDKTLKPYLRDPDGGAPAVLAWAVEGCLRWQREGLQVPAAVKRSTVAYRQESDPLAAFIEDCLTFNPLAWSSWADLWRTYNEHAEEMGTGERYRVAPKRLQERLRAHDCRAERRKIGRGWAGVELCEEWQGDTGDAGDTFSKTFLREEKLEKVCEMASPPSPPSPHTAPEPTELDFSTEYEEGVI